MRALTPLTEEQRAIQTVAREFAAEHIAPFSDQWDRDQYFERRLWLDLVYRRAQCEFADAEATGSR